MDFDQIFKPKKQTSQNDAAQTAHQTDHSDDLPVQNSAQDPNQASAQNLPQDLNQVPDQNLNSQAKVIEDQPKMVEDMDVTQNSDSNLNLDLDKPYETNQTDDLPKVPNVADLPQLEMPDLDDELIMPDLSESKLPSDQVQAEKTDVLTSDLQTPDDQTSSDNLAADDSDDDMLMAGNLDLGGDTDDSKDVQNDFSVSLGDKGQKDAQKTEDLGLNNFKDSALDANVEKMDKTEENPDQDVVEPIDFSSPDSDLNQAEKKDDENKPISWASLKEPNKNSKDALDVSAQADVKSVGGNVEKDVSKPSKDISQHLDTSAAMPAGLEFATAESDQPKSDSKNLSKPKKHGFLKVLLALGPLFFIGSLAFAYFALKGGSGVRPEVFNSTDNCDDRGKWISDCRTYNPNQADMCSGWYTSTCGGSQNPPPSGGQECSYEGCHSGRKWCGNDHKWHSNLDNNCNECQIGEAKCDNGTTKECADTGLWYDTGEACNSGGTTGDTHAACWDSACIQVAGSGTDECGSNNPCEVRNHLDGHPDNCNPGESTCSGGSRYECNNDGNKWKHINSPWCDGDGNIYSCNGDERKEEDTCSQGCSGNNPPACIGSGGGTTTYACSNGTPNGGFSGNCGDYTGDESTCWSHGGSGCGFVDNACVCNDSANSGGSARCDGANLCNTGNTTLRVSVASCSKDETSKSQCQADASNGVGCSSQTISLAPGECTSQSNSSACSAWQTDAVGGGVSCSNTGCNWDDVACSPPEVTYSCNILTVDKNTARVGDVIHFNLTGQTSGPNNNVFNRARFKVNSGSWTNVSDTSHPFEFDYTIAASDGNSINFVGEVAHGDPSVWESGTGCNQTVIIDHAQLACLEIRSSVNYQNIDRGSDVAFTCVSQGSLADHADFRMLLDNNVTNDATSGVAFNGQDMAVWRYHVDESAAAGTYLAQCRVCDDGNNCTQWGRSDSINLY